MPSELKSLLKGAALFGVIAGTIDIGAASLISGYDPLRICGFIASGLIGRAAAVELGILAVILGLVLQWLMSILIAAIYASAAFRLPLLRQRWLTMGLAYGVGVFFVMNYVVVPLSAIGRTPNFSVASFIENLLAMLLFGVIVAYPCARDSRWPIPKTA